MSLSTCGWLSYTVYIQLLFLLSLKYEFHFISHTNFTEIKSSCIRNENFLYLILHKNENKTKNKAGVSVSDRLHWG